MNSNISYLRPEVAQQHQQERSFPGTKDLRFGERNFLFENYLKYGPVAIEIRE